MSYLKNEPKPMIRRLSVLAVHGAMAMLATAAQADDGNKMFSVGGFGTVGATHSSSSNGDYVGTQFQTTGAGATRNWDMGVDSKLGVQLNGKFTEQLSGVVQVVAMDRTDNTFGPRIEWANLQYAITPDLKVRVGRIALPGLMVSDTRLVGYSNPWIRTPMETYGLSPVTNSDGIDASYKMRFGSVGNTIQAFDGRSSFDLVGQSGAISRGLIAEHLHGFTDTVEYGALTVRAGLTRTDVSINLAPGYTIAPVYQLINLGAIYDPGTWFVQGEVSKRKLEVIAREVQAFYVTAGYRLKDFTPYATYSQTKPDDNNVGLSSVDQKTSSIGLRWDAMKNTDVKLQWDRVSLGNGNYGYFANVKPALAGSTVNVASVAVDFVF